MPTLLRGAEDLDVQTQLFVSEHMMNSALTMMHEEGRLELRKESRSAALKTLFGDWEEVFGRSDRVVLLMQSASAPRVTISEGVSVVDALVRLRFLNPYNAKFDAVTVLCDMHAELEFEGNANFTLAGRLINMTLAATELKMYFRSGLVLQDIHTQIAALAGPLMTIANSQLSSGVALPVPPVLKEELSRSRLFVYDHFVMLEADPQIADRVGRQVDSFTAEL